MNSSIFLSLLPKYENRKTLINKRQKVGDIINEILDSHQLFASHYDKISSFFDEETTEEICSKIYTFLKKEIAYKVEGEENQTTKTPAAILAQRFGDCKHYASFSGGILDSLNRTRGKKIKWEYRFASYSLFNRDPEHIFTVVFDRYGKEIWIDPTPGAEKVTPVWIINKIVKKMPLYRISGTNYGASNLLDETVNEPAIYSAVQLLLKWGVIDTNGKINDRQLIRLQKQIPAGTFQTLYQARQTLSAAAIGGFFDTIWRGVKKVTLLAPRNAFLGLVGINAFGYATKLKNTVYNSDGTYTAQKAKIKTLWQDKLGGDWTALENTINKGATKKAILGVAPAAATVPAWVATAGAVIAVIMPVVTAFLNAKQKETGINYDIDPVTGLPYSGTTTAPVIPGGGSGDPLSFVKENPLIVAGGIFALYYFTKKKSNAK